MGEKKKPSASQSQKTPYRFPTVYPGMPLETMQSSTDPQGSYTGIPADGGVPVQDADDL